jgi:hypothetical protein
MSEEQKKQDRAPVGEKAGDQPSPSSGAKELSVDESSRAAYANLCRVTGTPEEVVMDFALNVNAFGPVLDEQVKVDHRIVMGYQAAKRTALVMLETVRRYEERFGEIELDPRKRLKDFKVVQS